ncbi:MAG: HdeD family acid-resistance protein [Leptolyngbya sp. SIO4C1]|nr:HdeD family acid-resistance protein [Leptolyngbya sp. SIO4C1]
MESQQYNRQSGLAIVLGILMILLGIIAIASPLFAAIAAELFLGWLFIVGSVLQAIEAFQHYRAGSSLFFRLLLSLLYLMVGILLLANPWAGTVSLTLIVGIFFFIDGVFRVFLSFQLKPAPRWGWVLLSGILMIILGILIWSQWPFNAPWILGLLVGVGLLVNGIATLLFGTSALTLQRR